MMNKNEALKVQGFTALRKPQETTLDCLLAGQDAVCIMGTGSGKSAIFTTFALMQEQLVIVIEPHLALELDQVRLLRERDIAAAAINSMTGAKASEFLKLTWIMTSARSSKGNRSLSEMMIMGTRQAWRR